MPHLNDKRHLVLCFVLSFALSFVWLPLLHATDDTAASIAKFQQTMALKGHASAQYKLAMIYETGEGVTQDIPASRIWYSRAADQAYMPAAHRLAYLDMQHNHRHADPIWLNQLHRDADAGDGEIMLLLGQMYAWGTGLTVDLKQASKYLRQARSQNIPGSETELARVEARLKQQDDIQIAANLRAAADKKLPLQKTDTTAADKKRAQYIQQQLAQRQHTLAQQQRLTQATSTSPAKPPALADRKVTTPLENTNQSPCQGRHRFAPTCR